MTFNFFLQSSVEVDLSIMWITIAGFLVFFMHAGFTLVEAGFTQAKNAVNIAMKNLMAISVGTIVYWFIGYSLMYGETSNGFFRWSGFFAETAPHDLFFQTMFAATCATIVSGAVAGRTKYSVFAFPGPRPIPITVLSIHLTPFSVAIFVFSTALLILS